MINKISALTQLSTLTKNEIQYLKQNNIKVSEYLKAKELQANIQDKNSKNMIVGALAQNTTKASTLETIAQNKDYLYARIKDQINFNQKNEEAKTDKKSFCGFFKNLFKGKKTKKKYQNLNNRLESIKNNPQKLADMYKEVCGKNVDLAELNEVQTSNDSIKNATAVEKAAIKKSLTDEVSALENSVKSQVKKQGNFTWLIGKVRNGFGANATESKTKNMVNVLKSEIQSLSKMIDEGKTSEFCAKYKTITGKSFDLSNKNIFNNSEASNSTAKFLKQNKTAANVVTTVATTAAGIAISVATLGAGTGALIAGAVGGAVINAGVGALTKIQADGSYEIKDKKKAAGSFFKDFGIDLGISLATLGAGKAWASKALTPIREGVQGFTEGVSSACAKGWSSVKSFLHIGEDAVVDAAKEVTKKAIKKETAKSILKLGAFHSAKRIKKEIDKKEEAKKAAIYDKLTFALENRKKSQFVY